MKNPTTILTLALTGILALSGCSKKDEVTEADVQAAAAEVKASAAAAQAESEKKMEDKLAAGLASIKEESDNKLAAAQEQMDSKLAEEKAAMEEKMADEKAEMEAKLEEEKAALKAEMEEKLAAETESLKKQFASNASALQSQYDSLKSKYDSIKDSLPEDVVSAVSAKLPELSSSIGNLQSLASKFSPSTLEQIEEFKTKYQSELTTAKSLADEILKLVGKGSVESLLPKL
ncbi:hypothetical protein [Pelagicoccus albus]|uniref:Lipoprotein n=1 Tax=Pelagicoccus albus TaxID=415222 RepID=A0A7X1B8P7_9BACT|nr:hypothetical protein [Pelagicoccus albus]MBC2606448.1 hypothetical protein [Pelagicoccus albus]